MGRKRSKRKIGNESYAHASNQNIVQFTTESAGKSSLIVKKCFCSKV